MPRVPEKLKAPLIFCAGLYLGLTVFGDKSKMKDVETYFDELKGDLARSSSAHESSKKKEGRNDSG